MTAAGLHFEGVSKTFGRSPVLDGVSLSVDRGERVALVGPNGAGKTTLIRCLLGEYVCGGEISVAGRSPRDQRTDVLRRIGFVPQLPPPLRMSVAQLVRFASDLCEHDAEAIERQAALLGLDVGGVRRQPFLELSGGQKQKLLIAIALRERTELLIMDEPAANLDPEARRTFFELLAARGAGTTMLISSHRLDEVAALVSRVVELDHGRIVLDERVAGAADLRSVLRCRLELRRSDESAAKALGAWGFRATEGGLVHQGSIAGADRLRFLGTLARYSGLVTRVALDEHHGEPDREDR